MDAEPATPQRKGWSTRKRLAVIAALVVVAAAIVAWLTWAVFLRDSGYVYRVVFTIESGDVESEKVLQSMRPILEKRLDPKKVQLALLGGNRIEIRVPLKDAAAAEAWLAYQAALQRLTAGNITDDEIERIQESPSGHQRDVQIQRIAGANTALGDRLRELAQAYAARAKAIASGAPAERSETRLAYAKKRKEINQYNIDIGRLTAILGNYVSPQERSARDADKEELNKRQKAYESGLKKLVEAHKPREGEIREVDDLHRKYANERRYLEDPADLKRLIAKAGVLEFRIAPERPRGDNARLSQSQVDRYTKWLRQPNGAEEMRANNEPYLWFGIRGDLDDFADLNVESDETGKPHVLLHNEPSAMMLSEGAGGWRLAGAFLDRDSHGRPAVGFEFDDLGAGKFARLTSANKGRRLTILLDDEAFSSPTIKAVISKRGIIEMAKVDRAEVDDLIRTLEAGSLPGRLNPQPVVESSFGAALGDENAKAGIRAAVLGLLGVAVFMLIYYLLAGLIANVALVLNIVLVLGAMSLLNAVFTLPGIAGVILTIGIAVDANVLIFERLREEQAKGQSNRMALKNAYERAFTAIFDANITTLVTCLILGWVGTEEVRGFAITLGLGVAFSLFTALVITRWIFQVLLDKNLLKKPVFMLQIIGVPKVDWMGKRYIFWAVSSIMIAMGIASLVWQGREIWGLDFRGGTRATFQFRDDALLDGKLPNDEIVRTRFAAAAGANDRLANARVETLTPAGISQADSLMMRRDTDRDGKITLQEWRDQKLDERAFQQLDRDGNGHLDMGELDAMPSLRYQLSTTEMSVPPIREVASKAFGNAQERRVRCTYELVKDAESQVLGLPLDRSGRTRVRIVEGDDRDLLEDCEGGVMFVIRVSSPPMTEGELRERIAIMRRQTTQEEEFEGLQHNRAHVRLLSTDAQGRRNFAILIRPNEEPSDWDRFAEKEFSLLTAALEREEALIAENFDAAIAMEASQKAIVAVVLSWLAIVLYLWLRFGSAQWGLAAVICLIHDVIIVVGMVAVSGWVYNSFLGRWLGMESFKIDLVMVAAILTIIGYSVNDTIVVFDRIRENRGKLTTISTATINTSINQTLARTLLTSSTTFIVVFIMYVWGGSGIHGFTFALLIGILFGTYSSVAVASPLLMGFRQAVIARAVRSEAATK